MTHINIKLLLAIACISIYTQAQESGVKSSENSSGKHTISNTSLNSKYSDFAPVFYQEGLVFSSARDTGLISSYTTDHDNQPFSKMYIANGPNDDTMTIERWSKKLNTKGHESSAAFTKDGKTIYFTRNNYSKRYTRDEQGISRLQIYKASLVKGQWKNIIKLPFNATQYSVAHPTLNKDESKLYFASDMPGTLGASDIFYVSIDAKGNFGEPINLGADVNTKDRETFPFMTQEDVLYFASDRKESIGGLDVFATNFQKNETHSMIVNLGAPINSTEDDFGFIIDKNAPNGYFASNREGGMGSDDIYAFQQLKAPSFKLATPTAFEEIQEEKIAATVAEKVVAKKSTLENIVLPTIYFDINKDAVKDDAKIALVKVIEFMKEHPEAKLIISSHTDSRGNNRYNLQLSERRAQETRRYLISKGIPANRLTTKGFGESQLLNQCGDNQNCSETEHNLNRRSEFSIVT